ncbi:ABC transporter permease [Clostridium sp. WLY-B-L2]|jgi:peptide/nickel transport system permease protein|uniref:ABC transporter permease n=1 Tax=Clostridium aromativorans TaxID=2836848 RepID=A0ABS8N8X9_9CLOT|nr:oligopeptide ABC transporter permease [Clostridium aromativorans]MCC9295173.1 ABC transporter permease [Clostridium aromativorans]CAB1248018.1 oligopeptide ABC transporter (permease) [Clostridiaceae bacterium BL-3]
MSKMEAELKNGSSDLAIEATESSENYARLILKRFKKHKMAVTGVIFIAILAVIAVAAPLLAPQSPYAVENSFGASPSAGHILGTDQVGRDVMSRLIYAARVSLVVGIGTVILSVGIGTVLGLISGYFGGKVDMIIMRITDIFMSFPQMMLILVVVSIVGPGLWNIIWVLGFLGWPSVARLVRGNVLSIKEMDYVRSSVALGFSTPRILFSHILPNTMAPILVNATFGIARAIIYEASLSFLGMGVQPPTASWGNMLTDAQAITVLTTKPWLWFPPGIMIVITVLAFNFIGDGLRDAFDPTNER